VSGKKANLEFTSEDKSNSLPNINTSMSVEAWIELMSTRVRRRDFRTKREAGEKQISKRKTNLKCIMIREEKRSKTYFRR